MEIIILLVLWAITVPICFNCAKKINSNKTTAILAGIFIPILSAIVYSYLASNYKKSSNDIPSEENISSRQQEFESKHLADWNHMPLPGYLDTKEATIYLKMRDWFVQLEERYSRDADKTNIIKKDWYRYLWQLECALSSLADDENALRVFEIEKRFAKMMGENEIGELKKLRKD